MSPFTVPDERPFLEAILEDPENDVPRLIFADWLEDRGDPRAEFIRVQCELAALEEDDLQHERLSAREHELLRQHGDRWKEGLPEIVQRAYFERGFVGSIGCTSEEFLRNVDEVWNRNPVYSLLVRCTDPEHIDALKAIASLGFLRELCVRLGDAGAVALAGCPYLSQLTMLDLSHNYIRVDGAEALANSPHLDSFRTLILDHNDFGRVEPSLWHVPRTSANSNTSHSQPTRLVN